MSELSKEDIQKEIIVALNDGDLEGAIELVEEYEERGLLTDEDIEEEKDS